MHISQALDLHFSRRNSRASLEGAGVGAIPRRWRNCFCVPCGFLTVDLNGQKLHVWLLVGLLMGSSMFCIGMFEATRLTTHVLRSPCKITTTEAVDVGTCSLCDERSPQHCEMYPITTLRVAVKFRPLHQERDVIGTVWYCKGRATVEPCTHEMRFLDQLSLDMREYGPQLITNPIPCTTGEVFAYAERRRLESETHDCYYSSRDSRYEEVWLSMPSPGLVDHNWFQKHFEYPVLLGLGGLILLSVLLGCMAVEGAELWASGLL